MELHTYTLSKEKPYFIIPNIEGKEGVVLSKIIPEVFNPNENLSVIIRSETKSRKSETSTYSLIDFVEKYVGEKEFIPLINDKDEKFILVTILLGKVNSSGQFIELDKLDPDKIADLKILVEYKYHKSLSVETA